MIDRVSVGGARRDGWPLLISEIVEFHGRAA
jgi:hypothetical protein